MENMTNILFVSPVNSSFVQSDFDLLCKHYNVRRLLFTQDLKDPCATIRSFVRLIIGVVWADLTFSWFADVHAYWAVLFSRVFGRKSIVVLGGYEVANLEVIDYGLAGRLRSLRRVRYVLTNASRILPVDQGLVDDAARNINVSTRNMNVVPTGFDPERFKLRGTKLRKVVTVCLADSYQRAVLKGLDVFVRSAALLPEYDFLVIGVNGEARRQLSMIAPQNLGMIGPLPQEDLLVFLSEARVYCQLSMREGLPNSLCEAMLCECVPVGTNVPGIETAIGDTGFYVGYGDYRATACAITEAMKSERGYIARKRIVEEFSLSKRETSLLRIIEILGRSDDRVASNS